MDQDQEKTSGIKAWLSGKKDRPFAQGLLLGVAAVSTLCSTVLLNKNWKVVKGAVAAGATLYGAFLSGEVYQNRQITENNLMIGLDEEPLASAVRRGATAEELQRAWLDAKRAAVEDTVRGVNKARDVAQILCDDPSRTNDPACTIRNTQGIPQYCAPIPDDGQHAEIRLEPAAAGPVRPSPGAPPGSLPITPPK